jgi:hypothetical protein
LSALFGWLSVEINLINIMKEIKTKRITFTFVRRRDGFVVASMLKEYRGKEYEVSRNFLYYTKKQIVTKLRKVMRAEIEKHKK